MCTGKLKRVVLNTVLIVLFVILSLRLFTNDTFAKITDIQNEGWNVKLVTNEKDIITSETKYILFETENNKNVSKGKIAPGCKATATIELNLEGTSYPVDFILDVDLKELPNGISLSANIDNEEYELGKTKTFEPENNGVFGKEDGKKIVKLTLEWKDNNNDFNDNKISISNDKIELPIKYIITQK